MLFEERSCTRVANRELAESSENYNSWKVVYRKLAHNLYPPIAPFALTASGILRCEQAHERSGTDDDADGCRGGAGGCGSGGCGIFVGLLVSGGAEHRDFRAKTCDGDAAGSAVGAWQNLRGESVCDAGFLPAPGDTAFVWAA